jgi:hypothetical protein
MDDFLENMNNYCQKILVSPLFRPSCDFIQAPPLIIWVMGLYVKWAVKHKIQ